MKSNATFSILAQKAKSRPIPGFSTFTRISSGRSTLQIAIVCSRKTTMKMISSKARTQSRTLTSSLKTTPRTNPQKIAGIFATRPISKTAGFPPSKKITGKNQKISSVLKETSIKPIS